MKKIVIGLALMVIAIGLVLPSVVLASSFGLNVGNPPTSVSIPAKVVFDKGYPQQVVAWADTTVDYGYGAGWICWWGKGIKCNVAITGDEVTRTVNVNCGVPEVIPSGYEPAPLEYISVEPSAWDAAPSNGYKDVWIRFNLPNESAYWGKHYVFTVTFSLLQEGGQGQVAYQSVSTFYIVTQDFDIPSPTPTLTLVPTSTPTPTAMISTYKTYSRFHSIIAQLLRSRFGR